MFHFSLYRGACNKTRVITSDEDWQRLEDEINDKTIREKIIQSQE